MTTTQETQAVPTLYIAMSPNYWGRGETIEAAKAALKEHGGTLRKFLVYRLPDGAIDGYVDNMGRVSWEWSDPEGDHPMFVDLEIVAKRGI